MIVFLRAFYVIFRYPQVVFKGKPILVIQSKPAPITGKMLIADFMAGCRHLLSKPGRDQQKAQTAPAATAVARKGSFRPKTGART